MLVDQAARISNGRWMMGAVGAAVAAGLTPNDTVYCCLPREKAALGA